MKIRKAIRYAALGAIVGVPGTALAQPPTPFGGFTIDGTNNSEITDTSGVCSEDIGDDGFSQSTCVIGGDTFFRTIIAEAETTTNAASTAAQANFVNESFVQQNGGGGVALNNQVDLGGGGLGARAISTLHTGGFLPTSNAGSSIFTGNYVAEIDHYQSVPGLVDAFRLKEGPIDDNGEGEMLAFMQDNGGSAGSVNFLELDGSSFAEFTSRGDFLHAIADPAQATGTATGPDGSTLQFDGGDSVSWTRFASDEGGDPAMIAFSEFQTNPNGTVPGSDIGGDVLGGTSADWVTFGGNVPYYDFGADAFFGGDLQSGL